MKNLIIILCLCLSINLIFGCINGEEVELWGECYNIENTNSLNLHGNQLSGDIPSEIGQLINLEHLHLFNNQLTGEIPSEIGQLTNLEHLQLFNNQLTGEIPSEIGQLTNLEHLQLYNNQLIGEIPSEIGDLINVMYLYLNDNQLSGEIPFEICNIADPIPSLFNNQFCPPYPDCISQSNIDSFDVSECFVGCIDGEEIELWGDCYNIETTTEINFINNPSIIGEIPSEIGALTNLTILGLSFNQLTGYIPVQISDLVNLEYLSLRDNYLTGEIPPEIGNLINLGQLELQNNQLSGEIPPEICNQGDSTPNLGNNQLCPPYPECIQQWIIDLQDTSECAGNLNDDQLINVQDVIILVNFILGDDSPEGSEFYAADLNSDGILNIQDIIILINIILA